MNILGPVQVLQNPKRRSSIKNREMERRKISIKLLKRSSPNGRKRLKQPTNFPVR